MQQIRASKLRLLLSGDFLKLDLVGEATSFTTSTTTSGGADSAPGFALGLAVLGQATTHSLAPG